MKPGSHSKDILNKSTNRKPKKKPVLGKRPVSGRQLRNRLIIIFGSIIFILFIAVMFVIHTNPFRSVPEDLTITVAWSPGSTVDEMVRVLAREMDSHFTLSNISGANGANGANAVFRSPHNGGNILATTLSSFVTSEAMGFADSSHRDWETWLCAFSPAFIVVAYDSPYMTIHDLIAAIRDNPGTIRCADDGYGSIAFTAAELFSSKTALEVSHVSFSGNTPAIDAVLDNNAEFAILLSTQVINHLQAGLLRPLGVFRDADFLLGGDTDIIIPSIAGISDGLDALLPYGEYYGFFIPGNIPDEHFEIWDKMIKSAVASLTFTEFIRTAGIVPITPDRNSNSGIVERYSSVTNWTLYNAGFLPTNPDKLGIPSP